MFRGMSHLIFESLYSYVHFTSASGAVSSPFKRYDSSDAPPSVHSSEHAVSKYGSMLNKGRKREVLIDDVVGSASSRVTATLDGAVGGLRGQSKDNLKNTSPVSGAAGRTSLDSSKGDRKTKAKPKQKINNHLPTSGNGFNDRLTEPFLPNGGSSQPSSNPSKMTERGGRSSSPSKIHQNSSKEVDEPIDFADLDTMEGMDSLLNFDEDGLQDYDSIGLEIPMDDLSDLKFAF